MLSQLIAMLSQLILKKKKWDVYIPGEVFKTQPATIYSAGEKIKSLKHPQCFILLFLSFNLLDRANT